MAVVFSAPRCNKAVIGRDTDRSMVELTQQARRMLVITFPTGIKFKRGDAISACLGIPIKRKYDKRNKEGQCIACFLICAIFFFARSSSMSLAYWAAGFVQESIKSERRTGKNGRKL